MIRSIWHYHICHHCTKWINLKKKSNKLFFSFRFNLIFFKVTSIYYTGDPNKKAISIDLYKSYIRDSIEYCKKVYILMKCVLIGKIKPSDLDQLNDDDHASDWYSNKQKRVSIFWLIHLSRFIDIYKNVSIRCFVKKNVGFRLWHPIPNKYNAVLVKFEEWI